MIPLFIVSPPRSRGSVLARLLNASGAVTMAGESDETLSNIRKISNARSLCERQHGDDAWPWRYLTPHGGSLWRESAKALLPAWVQPRRSDRYFGVRLQWLGREGMVPAFEWWSWLLETWPDASIAFVARDQGEIEMSMLCTQDLWMPKWGKCAGCVGGRVYQMQEAMAEFHWLNPSRTLWIDAEAMVSDHAAFAEAIHPLDLEIDEKTWRSVIDVKLGSWKHLRPKEDGDPFHPLADLATLHALPGPAEVPVVDIFSPDATLADLHAMPAPEPKKEKSDLVKTFEQEPSLRLTVPRNYKAVAAGELAVYTLRWGHRPWMDHCVPTQEAWAKRHGYEIRVWGEPKKGKYPNAKFSCLDMMREFLAGDKKYLLYFDADVIFHPDAPGWEKKRGFRVAADMCERDKFWRDLDRWMRRHYRGLRGSGHVYRNAGVWSCDREAARRFLREAESHDLIEGCMEQHQFNVFWQRAAQVGMRLETLSSDWNMMVHTVTDKPAWIFHLAGGDELKSGYLEAIYRNALVPEPPRKFKPIPARSEKAIVIPWIIGPQQWEELRLTLRSWQRFFADKECPIYILGDAPPKWLLEGGRVKFIEMKGYRKSRDAGYFEARYTGYQLAEKVIFTNDDIYLLRDQDWSDFEVALTEGVLHRKAMADLRGNHAFRRLMAFSAADLTHHGFRKVRRFATHTPFLFERGKAIEILRKFHVRYKGTFANFYHNWHGTPHRHCGPDKTMTLPASPEARFLNHTGGMPNKAICEGLLAMFPDPAPWENPEVPMVDPAFPPGTRICVASHGENLGWLEDVDVPATIYDATGDSGEHVAVPNVGREAGQYLRHIIAHYGRFADYELFVQGHPFDHNPELLDTLKAKPWEGQRAAPLGYVLGRANQANLTDAIQFAKQIGVAYDADKPWVHGALFAASRAALMARPRRWWKMVLRKVEAEPMAPWAMERLWLTILDSNPTLAQKNP